MNNNNKLVILYGSQTGNSQDLAERIWRQAKSLGMWCSLSSFDKYDLSCLNDKSIALLTVCSTTGQGDVPDNMLKFWRFIMRKSMPSGCLTRLKFASVGLGDSSYDKYNYTAKKLHKRFVQLGAEPLLELCLCDEQQREGIEGAYSKWIGHFWRSLGNSWPLAAAAVDSATNGSKLLAPKYKIFFIDEQPSSSQVQQTTLTPIADELSPHMARLVRNERMTHADHWQDVRLIELERIDEANRLPYEPGDVLVMRPSNHERNVAELLEMLEPRLLASGDLTRRIRLEPRYPGELEPENEANESLVRTVRDLFTSYMDVNSVPRMSFFEQLALLADDELEKEKLIEFYSTPEGLEDLYAYCYRPRRTILEVLHDFPKTCARIDSLERLLDLVPSIKPRSFSIASGPRAQDESRVQLLVAVVEYKTRLRESRKGTCSYWLSTLEPTSQSTRIPVWIKKGSFLIANDQVPLICVGPGTGVAPFRSIISERFHVAATAASHPGSVRLYFGCRSARMDYYFEHEWNELTRLHADKFTLRVAFSRDQAHKIYVQDLLLEDSKAVFDLLDKQRATVLIAGNSKRMPQDVLAILERIVKEGLTSECDADAVAKVYMKRLESEKRIQLETWS
jgi:sulfite reductase alpha subunit-like flavoprotein